MCRHFIETGTYVNFSKLFVIRNGRDGKLNLKSLKKSDISHLQGIDAVYEIEKIRRFLN